MRRLVVLVALAASACRPSPRLTTIVTDTVAVADSACLVRADSLAVLLREQRILVGLAEQQMMRYAQIVQRDPTQARFLVGWTRRAFAGVPAEEAP
jgi:hypothetical protein